MRPSENPNRVAPAAAAIFETPISASHSHIPQKASNPYELTVCPWNAIEMVPTEQVAQYVAQIGGPPEYIEKNWDRLVGTAQHLAELKAGA